MVSTGFFGRWRVRPAFTLKWNLTGANLESSFFFLFAESKGEREESSRRNLLHHSSRGEKTEWANMMVANARIQKIFMVWCAFWYESDYYLMRRGWRHPGHGAQCCQIWSCKQPLPHGRTSILEMLNYVWWWMVHQSFEIAIFPDLVDEILFQRVLTGWYYSRECSTAIKCFVMFSLLLSQFIPSHRFMAWHGILLLQLQSQEISLNTVLHL